jgi:DNA-binding beta-propeller fold protein YncE
LAVHWENISFNSYLIKITIYPHQIAIDSLGNVYLPDKDGSTVLKFDGNGNFITKWGSNGTGDGQFKTPHGVAIDPKNKVFVTDMDMFKNLIAMVCFC